MIHLLHLIPKIRKKDNIYINKNDSPAASNPTISTFFSTVFPNTPPILFYFYIPKK